MVFALILTLFNLGYGRQQASDTLIVAAGDTVISLNHRFIIPESVQFLNCVKPPDLKIDAVNGRITGHFLGNDSQRVVVTYQFLDIDLPTVNYVNAPPEIYIPTSQNLAAEKQSATRASVPHSVSYDFLKSGTIYRGVTIGSQSNLTLHSGLNLELDGKLSDEISIQGVLSDQNLPIQPEGNTQTLEEIDKVFIRVRLPHEQVVFGDCEVNFKGEQLGNYSRRLEGIYLNSQRANFQTEAAGALTKGQYHSNYFMGEEGNQGPYQLIGRNGETAIIVLAGTERVWIDGVIKQRGENYDYVIDYSTAEITFTPRCLITAASRITVDFQYSDLVYQKNIWALRQSQEWYDSRVKLSAGYIQESDDYHNPLEIEISSKDRAYLKTIGDAEGQAFISTIYADSTGAYILRDSILVFVGAGRGTHTATFYNVGRQGCYKKVYSGELAYFQYVDVNDPATSPAEIEQAQYLPVKPLTLPRQRQYFFVGSNIRPYENLSFKGELARSSLDRNRFSPLDDRDNAGTAYLVEANWLLPIGAKAQLVLDGKWQAEEKTFAPIDRLQTVEYHRFWNLPADSVTGNRTFQGGATFNWQDLVKINYSTGRLHQQDFGARRNAITIAGRYRFLEAYEFVQEKIESQKQKAEKVNWLRQTGRLQLNIAHFTPTYYLQREQQTGNALLASDFRFVEHKLVIQSPEAESWRWQLGGEWRRDDYRDSTAWHVATIGQNILFSSQISRRQAFSGQWDYVYRRLNSYNASTQPQQSLHMLNLLVKYEPLQAATSGELVWKIESEKAVKKERRYFYVGKGLGEYLYDSTFADYVVHPYGDYILRILPTNIKEPVTSLTNGLRWQFNGAALARSGLLSRISTITDLRLVQQLRVSTAPYSHAAVSPSRVDSLFLYFNRQLMQDIAYRPRRYRAEWRLRWRKTDQVSSLEVTGLERNYTDEIAGNYRGGFYKQSNLESELTFRHYQRQSTYSALRNRNIYSYRAKNALIWAFDRCNYLTTELTLMYDRQKAESVLQSRLSGLKFIFEQKLPQKGRWQAFFELDQVSVTPPGKAIPYEMSNGKKAGLTVGWGISTEYRLGSNLTMRASYEGWREPLYPVYHLGSGEIRAYF